MKPFKNLFFIAFLVLFTNTISAQYQNGYGGNSGYGNNGYGGSGRSNQMGQMAQDTQPSAPKPVPVEKTAAKILEYYKKELNLDALQEIVLTNIFIKSLKKEDAVMQKKEMSDEDKTNELKVLAEMTELEVKQILNKEQKAKFQILSDERKSKIESRKH
jgi:Spy/CpxP family protein refolding chaperone